MTVCAVVSEETQTVVNMIVAVASDPSLPGYFLVENPPDWATIGTAWDGTNFVEPAPAIDGKPPPVEGLDTL